MVLEGKEDLIGMALKSLQFQSQIKAMALTREWRLIDTLIPQNPSFLNTF